MEKNLDAKIAEAREAGTSYGKLMAANFNPDAAPEAPAEKPEEERQPIGTRICEICGKEFPVYDKYRHKYCSDECRKAAAKKKTEARAAGEEAEPDATDGPGECDAREMVSHPAHYCMGGIECIDALDAMVEGFDDPVDASLSWQVAKYIWRHPHKGKPLEDLQKARFYLDALIKRVEDLEG